MTGPPQPDDDSPPYVRLLDADSVVVVIRPIDAGSRFAGPDGSPWTTDQPLDIGSKLAARAIATGDPVLKLGMRIGTATRAIGAGELVHTHNLRSDFIPTEPGENEQGNVSTGSE